MISVMRHLENRVYWRKEIIFEELDDANEILFVTSGLYDIGYNVNKSVKYRL